MLKLGMLNRLRTADQIGAFLGYQPEDRYRGNIGDAHACPVAKYIHALYPHAKSVRVGYKSIRIQFGSGVNVFMYTPPHVAQFVEWHDKHGFPELCLTEDDE